MKVPTRLVWMNASRAVDRSVDMAFGGEVGDDLRPKIGDQLRDRVAV